MSNIIKATKHPEGLILLVSDAHGQYIPQIALQTLRPFQWFAPIENYEQEISDVMHGPEHDMYWSSWDDLLQAAEATVEWEGNQYEYKLYQDGDLWAYCGELMTNEEWENFGFDPIDKPAPRGYTDYAACQDCLIWIANADDSGMDSETAAHVREMCARLPGNAVADGLDLGFSHDECDICNALPGNRYRVLVEDKMK